MSITLNIQIDQKGRDFLIKNNENVVLLFNQGENNAVAAIIIDNIIGTDNTVQFMDSWIEYVSQISSSPFNIITVANKSSVSKGNIYAFSESGKFTQIGTSPTLYPFGLLNMRSTNLTCGLGQNININSEGINPCLINVYSLPSNQSVYFKTSYLVRIFTAKGISQNMIIPTSMMLSNNLGSKTTTISNSKQSIIIGLYLEIDLNNVQNIYFDNETNYFKIGELPSFK